MNCKCKASTFFRLIFLLTYFFIEFYHHLLARSLKRVIALFSSIFYGSTYLCWQLFSRMTFGKNKLRSQLIKMYDALFLNGYQLILMLLPPQKDIFPIDRVIPFDKALTFFWNPRILRPSAPAWLLKWPNSLKRLPTPVLRLLTRGALRESL